MAYPFSERAVRPRARRPAFPESSRSKAFRRRFWPDATAADWSDWRWQLQHRIRDLPTLEKFICLSDDERRAIARHTGPLPLGITPYYVSLISENDATQPLRRTHIPVNGEYLRTTGEAYDPLGEDHDTVVPGLVHRYPDRVLFLATGFCSTYCRYCTRSRMVGGSGEYTFSVPQWQRAIDYIAANPQIRDVLLSGGDPLTIATDKLEWLLSRLRAISHVEFLRIGTKVPVVLPQRITRDLTRMLRRYHPLWMSIHLAHPDELTLEVAESTARLADAGIPLHAQTVLLKGINDDLSVMKQLMHGMLKCRIRPYYLYACDPISGSTHFRTTVEKGLEIIAGLRGHTTGYATPTFVVDAPGGGGKVPLLPNFVVGRDGDDLLLRNFEGGIYRYPDPGGRLGSERPASGAHPATTNAHGEELP
ncbi:KamA family radical SAM protein [Elioraea sp.]|uniref:KamA family radical SAM protein n=1 Tax=Elioraea sp. TaxID=2185103 RepID=UPI0025C6511E|nr:KamA family radical SAM protein [Elioraea sp.]